MTERSARMFPVHPGSFRQREERDRLGCPRSVPWSFLAPHEKQAIRNHDQDLEKLASRGGLSPAEMHQVVNGLDLYDRFPTEEAGVRWLIEAVGRHGGHESMTERSPKVSDWEHTVEEHMKQLPGGVGMHLYREPNLQDNHEGRLKLIMVNRPLAIEVERDVMTREEADRWGPKAAILIRQLMADLERLRFDEGDDA